MPKQPWPSLAEEQRWVLSLMEARLERTSQTPEELLARSQELRAEAAETDIRGFREAALALADRYSDAASTLLPK